MEENNSILSDIDGLNEHNLGQDDSNNYEDIEKFFNIENYIIKIALTSSNFYGINALHICSSFRGIENTLVLKIKTKKYILAFWCNYMIIQFQS